MSSLVPGYMTVSWTVSPPAVGVRATCGVEGWPAREGGGGGKERVYFKKCQAYYIHTMGGGEGRGEGLHISLTFSSQDLGVGLSRHSYSDK